MTLNWYYDIIEGFQSFKRWYKVIWQDRDYDFIYIYKILEVKIDNIIKRYEDYKYFEGQDKKLENLRICKGCLVRLIEDEYWQRGDYIEEDKIRNADLKLLLTTLFEDMQGWWD